jgi:RNA polymerase sigma-B factor
MITTTRAQDGRRTTKTGSQAHRLSGDSMLQRWRQTGDEQWRRRAIEEYMPLANKLAKRYHRGREPLEDLQQVAFLGLVKAVDRFDPDVGTRFASFAIPTIVGELRRHFRDATWSIHVPRGMQEDMLRVRQATTDLSERLQRDPTISELSEETGLDAEQIVEALQASDATEPSSLDGPLAGQDGEDSRTLGEALGDHDDGFDLVEHRTTIGPALRRLTERDRTMLLLRFAHDMTQSEIAARMGCSQMQVSRVLRRTLDQLSAQTRDDLRGQLTAG